MEFPDGLLPDFGIEIDFQKGSERPSRVFQTMAGLLESFETIDRDLIQSIDTKIKPVLILEDLETSSVKAWLRTVLETADDADLKNLKWQPLVGEFLVKGKYYLIDFLRDKTEISGRSQLEGLSENLHELAIKTDVRRIPSYEPIPPKKIGRALEEITKSISHLSPEDRAKYVTVDDEAPFNLSFEYVPEDVEELLTYRVIATSQEIILKVKKPDYLGESMWEFQYDGRMLIAKIMHSSWLERFQSREVEVLPGDSLQAVVDTATNYGFDGDILRSTSLVVKVIEVLPSRRIQQLSLPEGPSDRSDE